MSDTFQGIEWALEQNCDLRQGDAVHDPGAASRAVGTARIVGQSLAQAGERFCIVDDICVTGVRGATLPARLASREMSLEERLLLKESNDLPCRDYPSDGYVISEELRAVGGIDGLRRMCSTCRANATQPYPCGCTGFFIQSPWDPEIQEHLASIILRRGLTAGMADHFTPATPIWFGLWTRSPLSKEAAGILLEILGELDRKLTSESSRWGGKYWKQFRAALAIASRGQARLHVKMMRPGHVDFGWHTVFPHCPRCKAEADLKRWKMKYPTEMIACQVCGMGYSPREQASSERMSEDRKELRDKLGNERFTEFARKYLVARGHSEADAAEIVDLTETEEVERVKRFERSQEESRRTGRYVQESLYAGLQQEKLFSSDDPEELLGQGFRPAEFEQLLTRCSERGIPVESMRHYSVKEEMKRYEMRPIQAVLDDSIVLDAWQTYRKWRAEGCHELFSAHVNVPKDLVAEFERERVGKGM